MSETGAPGRPAGGPAPLSELEVTIPAERVLWAIAYVLRLQGTPHVGGAASELVPFDAIVWASALPKKVVLGALRELAACELVVAGPQPPNQPAPSHRMHPRGRSFLQQMPTAQHEPPTAPPPPSVKRVQQQRSAPEPESPASRAAPPARPSARRGRFSGPPPVVIRRRPSLPARDDDES